MKEGVMLQWGTCRTITLDESPQIGYPHEIQYLREFRNGIYTQSYIAWCPKWEC